MNGQTIIIILLSLIVAKLYPDLWNVMLISIGIYIALCIARAIISDAKKSATNAIKFFSISKTIDYAIGLCFCLFVIFSSVVIPIKGVPLLGMSFKSGYIAAVLCLISSLLLLYRRVNKKS